MSNATILLADDEAMVAEVTRAMLNQLGYVVITANDGNDALLKFDENQENIDLVILDYNMPGLDGFECLRLIREKSDIPVLISSGYGASISEAELGRMNAQGILQKPFALEDIRQKVQQLIQ